MKIQQTDEMRTIAVDTETYYDAEYSVKKLGTYHYTRDDRFDPYLVSVYDGTEGWVGHPRDFNWESLRGALLVAHNRAFDHQVYDRMVELGIVPSVAFTGWDCTANLTSFLCNRRALAEAYEFLYGEKVSKEVRAKASGKHWSSFTPDQQKAMLEYALRDAENCWRIWNDHSRRWPQFERDLSNQTIDIGRRGVAVDWEKVDRYIVLVHGMIQETERLLPWVEEGGKPTSPKEIAAHCRRCGIPAPPVKSHDEEAFFAWEDQYAPTNPWIRCISSRRSLASLLSLLHNIRNRRREDDTMASVLKYLAAHTGRWSGDAQINLQNQRKEPIFRNEKGLMELNERRCREAGKCHAATGKYPDWVTGFLDMRSLYIPRPGKKFIIADLSQIEPRVLNCIIGNRAMLDQVAKGMSIYEAFARSSMGWRGGDLKKEDKALYALAKAQVLGLGYGCGWKKFITLAGASGVDLTKDDPEFEIEHDRYTDEPRKVPGYGSFSRKCVAAFRAANPAICALWRSLDEAFRRSVGSDFEMELPSGRVMRYRQVRYELHMRADDQGKPIKERVYTAEIDGRRYTFYGGMLTENLVQATSRDIFAGHLLAIPRAGIGDVVFHVHDEVVIEADPDVPKERVVEIMSMPPEWMPDIPLAAEATDATCYQK